MNCKAGDLAVIVAAKFDPHYLGKIVVCVSVELLGGEYVWLLDPPTVWFDQFGKTHPLPWCDVDLRPIRDTPGADETLTWLDVPSERVTS